MTVALGMPALLLLTNLWSSASAAPVGDEEARKLVAQMIEGRMAARPGERSVQYAPMKESVALGDARRVVVQNLSYGYKDYRIKVGEVAVLVEPADAPGQPAVAGLGATYGVSFHLPDSVTLLQKTKPLGSVSIGYSSIAGRWSPQIRAFIALEFDLRALALTGVKGLAASIASAGLKQSGRGSADHWAAEGTAGIHGLTVTASDTTFRLEEASQTSTIDGFAILPWYEAMNHLMALIPEHPENQTEAQSEAMGADLLALFLAAPPFADHLGIDMKMSGMSVTQVDAKGADTKASLGQITFGMGYDAVAPAAPSNDATAVEPPVGLGAYRFGFAVTGSAVPTKLLADAMGPSTGAFVSHTVPTDVSFKIDLANVPTRALLAFANRASAAALARGRKDGTTDAPDDTAAKVAGDAWLLLKRVKTSLRTGFDIASDMVKIDSLSNYVADASQPSGQINTTKITVSGLDALLAAYKAPDPKAVAKPAPGVKKPAAADDEAGTILNFVLLGVRFVKGIGTPRVADDAIVYDYLIETDQNGTTLINGQDFAAMVDSFGKGRPDKM